MKKFFILPVLAALFTACTNDELVVDENKAQQTEEGAISFDAYLNRAVTRAGSVTPMDVAALKLSGFGVFAYYANGDLYTENAIPDFMYNQQVTYSGGWTYNPVKYWPNEFGSTAVSMGVDRVTFFAYAPYVTVDPSTGQLTGHYDDADDAKSTKTGITALTRNGKAGDPYVRYVGAFEPAKCVDLCYGVAAEAFTSAVDAGDGANNIEVGKPFINVAKPEVASKLKFNFKHALAQLNVQVDADVDIAEHNESNQLDKNTRIWVRSITFDGVAQRGYLNLNSGMWYDVIDNTKISHASVTVHDGRRDGAEALADDSYETPTGLNTNLIQRDLYSTNPGTLNDLDIYDGITAPSEKGVTHELQPLFSGSNPLLVIPANEQLKVTIVYDVETADLSLPSYLSDGKTKGRSVENKITKQITVGGAPLKLEAGNRYNIKLHLGMTSVKFDATVEGWTDPTDPADDTWLPENSGEASTLTAANPYSTTSVTIPYDATSYTFTVTGLNASEAVTKSIPVPGAVTSINGDATATAEGTYVAEAFVNGNAINTTTLKKTGTAQVVGGTSGKGVVYTITQEAHALGLEFVSYNAGTDIIWVKISDELTDLSTDKLSTSGVTVTVTDITNPSSPVNIPVTIDTGTGLKHGTELVSGTRKIRVEVTSNDVTESFETTIEV